MQLLVKWPSIYDVENFPDFLTPTSPTLRRKFFSTICHLQFWPIFDPWPLPIADITFEWTLMYIVHIVGDFSVSSGSVSIL